MADSQPASSRVIATAALSTVACVFPGLGAGALAVQASEDFGITEGTYGFALGAFFLGAAVSSTPLGQIAQRLGPRRQILMGLVATAIVQWFVAFGAASFTAMLGALAMAGVMNSAVQSAVNLALSQAQLPRLGLAVAIKQSAMPTSAMLGGLAVPLVALTIGWRWAYAMGGCVAVIAIFAVVRFIPETVNVIAGTAKPSSARRAILGAAVMSGCLAFAAGAINAWTVSSGVDAGVDPGVAGLAVSVAAGLGVTCRVFIGWRLDMARWQPLRTGGLVTMIGVVGFALLAVREAPVHLIAGVLAFAGGWVWPVFSNFALINANRERAAAVTGVSQTGVYLGVFLAPVVTGQLIDRAGYSVMWVVVTVIGALGAILAVALSPSFPRESSYGVTRSAHLR